MSYRFKRVATQGDIARISALCFTATTFSWLANALIYLSFELFVFQTILAIEHMVIAGYYMHKGTMFDFTGAPEHPRGWLASIYLEERK